jgi:hypothetical protein
MRTGFRTVLAAACSSVVDNAQPDHDGSAMFQKDYSTVYNAVVKAMRGCHPRYTTTTEIFADLKTANVTTKAAATEGGPESS